ncbi:MAG TPA: APC family permease [Actinomycetes bacterium]
MASQTPERGMVSEQVAPVLLSRVLNPFDLTVIFVAVVLFIVNSSTIQSAGPVAFTYWILGFLTFLIPGAIVTAQLGRMFPEEGSLYVWTHKALGPFWGFFAGFVAWWPGILVLSFTGGLVVTLIQALAPDALQVPWQQGLVILAVIWFSAIMSILRFRVTQNYVNVQFVFYAAAIFVIGLAGVLWLLGGHAAANSFALGDWVPSGSNWTFFGFVVLGLLGIEVPLNMGVEIKTERAISRYLVWGSLVVMAAYLWTTFGNMAVVPLAENHPTTGIVTTVERGIAHPVGTIVALILIWFFVSNTVVYNYSFARLLFVSGVERRLPSAVGRVNKRTKVPDVAVLVQSVLASIIVLALFMRGSGGGETATKVYLALLATVNVVWCVSMVLLFLDVFFVRRWFADKFEEVRQVPGWLLSLSGVLGAAASAVAVVVTFKDPWDAELFKQGEWRLWLGVLTGVSLLVAVAIFLISERTRRRAVPAGAAASAPPVAGA